MAVIGDEWLDLMEREYVRGFVAAGGAAVKFVVGNDDQATAVERALLELSERHELGHVAIDAATTKIHMIQDVFFAIARALDWPVMAQYFVQALFDRQGYEWPHSGAAVPIAEVASCNRIADTLLRRSFHQWLTAEVMHNTDMTQDFRVAMTRLCLRRLEPEDSQLGIIAPVIEWLRGELRSVGALKELQITSKITRHNGRAMLRSVCRWLRLCGRRGFCVTLDIRQLGKTGAAVGSGLSFSPAAVMDGFEVLRQLIDDAEHFAGLLLVVIANDTLIGDDLKRSLGAYQALKMRIWDDVRPEGRDNPLAPLVRLASQLRSEPALETAS
jgi:hypothetical protein